MKRTAPIFIAMFLFLIHTPANSVAPKRTWQDKLLASLKSLDATNPDGALGLYIKNIRTGKELSFRGDEFWYIASGTKLPVALETLRAVDAKTLSLETKVTVLETDYVDGAGELNYIKPESQVSIRLLLDQSLTFSDNTATDMLIRQVGLEKINALTDALAPKAFTPITTLSEVRRRAFSTFHPNAQTLSNMDFIKIRVLKEEGAKLDHLAKLLKVKRTSFKHQNFDSAFEAYYSERMNSATLRGYGLLLEKFAQGAILKAETQKHLMDVLERIETGQNRIKAGFPKSFIFAHKTGTQHRRYCDMGILKNGKPKSDQLVVVACVRKLPLDSAENLMRKIGQAIYDSGVFSKEPKEAK